MNGVKAVRQFNYNFYRIIVFSAILFSSLIYCNSCNSVPDKLNDNRTMAELFEHLRNSGLKIRKIFPSRYQAVRASDGYVLIIGEVRAEFYIYDPNIPKQKIKLDKIKKDKEIIVLAIPVPCLVNGKFVMFCYDNHLDLIKVKKAFKSFSLKKGYYSGK